MSFESEMQAALGTFLVEAQELLESMEEELLNLEQQRDPSDSIGSIFRAAHTIKGSAGMFGLDGIVRFTHVVENVLDCLRSGKIGVTSNLVATLLPCRDHIAHLVQTVADGFQLPDASQDSQGNALLVRLQPFLDTDSSATETPPSLTTPMRRSSDVPTTAPLRRSDDVSPNDLWHISMRCGINSLKNGMDPLALVRYLKTLGDIIHITTLCEGLPEAADMDAESSYLGFEIDLQTTVGKTAIEAVFEFVQADSVIRILPPHSSISDYIELIRGLPENPKRLGDILVNSGLLTARELETGLYQQNATKRPLGAILVEQQLVPQSLVDAALAKQRQSNAPKTRENQSIRVDVDKLDKLLNQVGELVIASAAANLRARHLQDVPLIEANAQVTTLIEEIRDSAIKLHMSPISIVFSRFQRVVRDTSAELGKDIVLQVSGGETEMGKTLIERIGDPLMHLVRNSMDHGIESAAIRAARGKPAQGTISLKAYCEASAIIIEVSDDGGGLNREKILAKAIERSIIMSGQTLSDKEVYALIFAPGFSTADQVSNISGRGVGMDVVKQNIAALKGHIELSSTEGVGTTTKITLPLTLSIVNGFLIGVGESFFVIPQDRIIECVALPSKGKFQDYMDLRGEVLPFIRLHNLFNIKRESVKREDIRRENVVVVDVAGKKIGLVVDRLLGEFQTVLKPLGKLFEHVPGIGGSTILGSGEVALIIDVPMLIDYYAQCEQAAQMAALNYA